MPEVQKTQRTTHIYPYQTHLDRLSRGRGDVQIEVFQIEGRAGFKAVITWEPVADGAYAEPVFSISTGEAQALVDRLYQLGFQPSAAAGSAGQLGAVQKHLEDFRAIVFHQMEVPKP